MQRVLIIKEGTWRQGQAVAYEHYIEHLRRTLEEALKSSASGQQVNAAEVEVVDTFAAAESVIRLRAVNEQPEIVIFVSRGMEKQAKALAVQHPEMKVMVFTGKLPEGEVIWVDKSSTAHSETLRRLVLG